MPGIVKRAPDKTSARESGDKASLAPRLHTSEEQNIDHQDFQSSARLHLGFAFGISSGSIQGNGASAFCWESLYILVLKDWSQLEPSSGFHTIQFMSLVASSEIWLKAMSSGCY